MGVGLKALTLALSVDGLMADDVEETRVRPEYSDKDVATIDAQIREVQSR
jgi:hypothetical protein